MKGFKALVLMIFVSMVGGAAHADYRPDHGYRYKVSYYQWDAGMYGYYGYNEQTVCRVTYTGGWTSRTCYNVAPTDYVYVEEQQMSGGYTRVTVYNTEYTGSPFVEYLVYDDGVVRRVERRHFYYHPYWNDDYYYSPYWHAHETVWVTLDWNNGWDKIFVGAYVAVIGADIAANSGGDSAGLAIGLASMAAGSLSMSSGADQLQEESECEKYIHNNNVVKPGTDVQ